MLHLVPSGGHKKRYTLALSEFPKMLATAAMPRTSSLSNSSFESCCTARQDCQLFSWSSYRTGLARRHAVLEEHQLRNSYLGFITDPTAQVGADSNGRARVTVALHVLQAAHLFVATCARDAHVGAVELIPGTSGVQKALLSWRTRIKHTAISPV